MVRSQITTFLMKFDTFRKIEGLGQSPGLPPPHPGTCVLAGFFLSQS